MEEEEQENFGDDEGKSDNEADDSNLNIMDKFR